MLTVMRLFVPRLKDMHYAMLVDWCIEKSDYYCRRNDVKQGAYWSKQACKYLLKRLDVWAKRS